MRLLADKLPGFLAWVNDHLVPWLKDRLGIEFQLDTASVRELGSEILAGNQDVAARLLGSIKIGGLALIAFFVNLLLVPVVLFYLLRDWNTLLARVDDMIPRHLHAKVRQLLREIDAVLAEFLRGQIVVMLVMCVYYVTALWLARLQFALPIGIITGVLVFIPYVGVLTGFMLGTMAALMQFDSAAGMIWVWLAFAIGQALEGTLVTPLLVGERIGLHPVAVIFALLAFGQVFGFFGVLLALPASAALLVGLAPSAQRLSGERSVRRRTALAHAATAARHLPSPAPTLDNFIEGANAEALLRVRELAEGRLRETVLYLGETPAAGAATCCAPPPTARCRRASRAGASADDVQALDEPAQIELFDAVQPGARGPRRLLAAAMRRRRSSRCARTCAAASPGASCSSSSP